MPEKTKTERLDAAEKRIDALERATRGLMIALIEGFHSHPGPPQVALRERAYTAAVRKAAKALGIDLGDALTLTSATNPAIPQPAQEPS